MKAAAEEETGVMTDVKGFFEASMFHDEYETKVTHPNGEGVSSSEAISLVCQDFGGLIFHNVGPKDSLID